MACCSRARAQAKIKATKAAKAHVKAGTLAKPKKANKKKASPKKARPKKAKPCQMCGKAKK